MYRLPDQITEAEVLALIEGDMASLPAERRDIVRESVARDPVLSRLVGEIRADSSAVMSMSRVAAPAGIRPRVIDDLKRPVLRPDLVREPVGGEIPVSSMIVRRENPWRRYVGNAAVRKLAAAASLLLAAGLGMVLISNAARRGAPILGTPGPIALIEEPAGLPDDAVPPEWLPRDIESDTSLALNLPEPGRLISDPLVVDPYGFPVALRADPAPAAEDPIAAALPAAMPASEAIALAREGRLVIRVRAASEADAHADIQQFALRTSRELKWRPLEAWELSEVLLAMRAKPLPLTPYASDKQPASAKQTPPAPAEEKPAPVIEPIGTAADVASALRHADFRPLFTVEMEENERDLATLLERLSKDDSRVVEFVALEEPLPTLIPSTEPAAVLWWTRPPSGWTRRVCIPIVLETLR